ncbi:MAG: hypothetical protein QFE16_04475 [Pseudomonadota bacterium]|nr:hypothetical protein [Pseudomonadota bacterium]
MNKIVAYIRRTAPATLFGGAVLGSSFGAFAVDPVDFTSITSGIAFAGVVTGILAVAAVKVLPLVASWGARKLLAMIGR